jgi:hypothetical protein
MTIESYREYFTPQEQLLFENLALAVSDAKGPVVQGMIEAILNRNERRRIERAGWQTMRTNLAANNLIELGISENRYLTYDLTHRGRKLYTELQARFQRRPQVEFKPSPRRRPSELSERLATA